MTISTLDRPPGAVTSRIRARRSEMSATMARIADYLVDHPESPVEASISDLAERTGTSAATVTRFCRLLGFVGYVSFRVAVAQDLGRRDANESWKTDIGREFGPDDSPTSVLSTLLNAHLRSMQETASVIDLELLARVAGRISRSRHIDVYGIGGSGLLARELQSRLYRIGISTHAWDELHGGLASAAIQDADCVAIAISNTGRTEATIDLLRVAAGTGAFTLAITNHTRTPLGLVAAHEISTLAHERFMQPDDLSGKHAQLLVLDLLYLLVAQASFDQSTTTLAATAAAVAPHRRPLRAYPARTQ